MQNRLLHMQAVFRLVINDGTRRVDDAFGDFQAAVGGQAVHENGIWSSLCEKSFVHLICRKGSFPLNGFVFLSHASPDIRVHNLGACYSFLGRAENFDFATRFTGHSLRFGDDGRVRLVTGGRGDANVRPQRAPATRSEWHMLLPSPT